MIGWTSAPDRAHRVAEAGGLYEGGPQTPAQIEGHGLIAGTRIASSLGWRPVEAIAAGDMVLTFDHGMMPVRSVRRSTLWPCATDVPPDQWPFRVPAGTMNNVVPMALLPDQAVVIECDAAEDAYGDPFAIVKASALDGLRGIARSAPTGQIDVITLVFDADQVIYAQGGFLTLCPCPRTALDELTGDASRPYDVLSAEEAAYLAACIAIEDSQSKAAM